MDYDPIFATLKSEIERREARSLVTRIHVFIPAARMAVPVLSIGIKHAWTYSWWFCKNRGYKREECHKLIPEISYTRHVLKSSKQPATFWHKRSFKSF